MAIRDKFEEQEKNGMKIVTNMNGEKRADNKLNMKKDDVFNLKDYYKYKDAIENDIPLKDVFPGNYPVRELEIFDDLLKKEKNKS